MNVALHKASALVESEPWMDPEACVWFFLFHMNDLLRREHCHKGNECGSGESLLPIPSCCLPTPTRAHAHPEVGRTPELPPCGG